MAVLNRICMRGKRPYCISGQVEVGVYGRREAMCFEGDLSTHLSAPTQTDALALSKRYDDSSKNL